MFKGVGGKVLLHEVTFFYHLKKTNYENFKNIYSVNGQAV